MKNLNKIFYDILLKINKSDDKLIINENLIIKYFPQLDDSSSKNISFLINISLIFMILF